MSRAGNIEGFWLRRAANDATCEWCLLIWPFNRMCLGFKNWQWRGAREFASSPRIPQSITADVVHLFIDLFIYYFSLRGCSVWPRRSHKESRAAFVKVQISLGNYHASNMRGQRERERGGEGGHCPVVHFNLLIHTSRGGARLDII